MNSDKGIWQAAWDTFCVNRKTVAFAIVAATALDLFTEYRGKASGFGMIMDLMIWSIVAISAHGTVLIGSTDLGLGKTKKLFGAFVWRSFVLLLLCLIPYLVVVYLIYDGGSIYKSGIVALPVLGLAALVIFSLLGTWLPAVVANGNRGIGTAIDRAERSFFYAAGRLLVGPGLLQITLVIVALLAYTKGILSGEVFGAAGLSIVDLIWIPANYAAQAYSVTMVAVILSRAYLKAEAAATPSVQAG